MNQVLVDFETQSEVDVSAVGAVEYAKHPSTRILCMGYKIDEQPTKIWIPAREKFPTWFWKNYSSMSTTLVAHNFGFEDAIFTHVFPRQVGAAIRINNRRCTAAKAAMHGLPRDLERATRIMNLSTVKDVENGGRLIKKYMKPRSVWKKWKESFDKGEAFDWEEPKKYFDDEDELAQIYQYCITDVESEYLLDKALSDLPPIEKEIWELNQRMNKSGVSVDVDTASLILKLIDQKAEKLEKELIRITKGEVTTAGQRDRILKWIKRHGGTIQNLRADTVKHELQNLKPSPIRRVLEIRQALSKSSTKKYTALLTRAGTDGRVRDLAMYHGAHTGRDSGTGLQLHNLPKGKIKNTDQAIEIIRTGDLGLIEFIYGDAATVFSSVIRGMIIASEGDNLFAADFNAIECRVLNWLAGQEDVLEDFRRGIDLYVKMAQRIGSDDRQLGKTIELASGFQMGPQKLQATSIAWGVRNGAGLTDEESERAIKAYRSSHPKVVKFWHTVETAAISAVRHPGKIFVVNRLGIAFTKQRKFLKCHLPCGRALHYFGPEVRNEATPWGEYRPKLYHWHIESQTKQWVCSATYGGKLVENIVQGVARDIMFDAALRTEARGYDYKFSVHDEIISESEDGDIREYEKILMEVPAWAEGLPLVAKGYSAFRYRKS